MPGGGRGGGTFREKKFNELQSNEPGRVPTSDLGGFGDMLPRKFLFLRCQMVHSGAFCWTKLAIYTINNCNNFHFQKGPLSFCAFSLQKDTNAPLKIVGGTPAPPPLSVPPPMIN